MTYTLQLKYKPTIQAEDNGNFNVTKEYVVTSTINPIRGFVIQFVKKSTSVVDASGQIYNTTASISGFTSNEVKYSNDSYFEIFTLNNGESEFADAFQNSSLTQYEADSTGKLLPHTYTVKDSMYQTFKTEGEIIVLGENCFISEDNPTYKQILKLPWLKKKNTPANGLRYLPYSAVNYNLFFSSSDSNILVHNVKVNWSFTNPKSKVVSSIIQNKHYVPMRGGKMINKSKRRNYTTKRINKKTSRKNVH
jgi:hypothetical protein